MHLGGRRYRDLQPDQRRAGHGGLYAEVRGHEGQGEVLLAGDDALDLDPAPLATFLSAHRRAWQPSRATGRTAPPEGRP